MTRIAVIEKEKCNPSGCGDFLCMRLCPINRTGKECIVKAQDSKAGINANLCTGCGICPKRCPFEAIHIINLPESLDQEPIHRYGKNGFHLYSLPTPMFGKVVGILGVNGIGKSTAIKIIAGLLKPNLGRDKEADFPDIIRYFKGTEAQAFFEKMRDSKIRISCKPQMIEMIPKQFSGKVIDLLRKVDEKSMLDEIAELLDIKGFLETDITKISGGELQRVAIAATVLKDADLYIFDEPTSYLDIKQRIKVSRFIRGMADEKTAVIVVEHDLIILDYMADLINIMYGEKGAYGIVSLPKPTKAGINVFLEGYLKEDNIRFRDSQIKFSQRMISKEVEKQDLITWSSISKSLGDFELQAEGGKLKKRDVCGVLGENGIGKTTFARIMAGVIEKDSGLMDSTIRVSYKPQYLESGSEETVAAFLHEAITKYEAQLARPLNLKSLLDKRLKDLSGGELQKAAIANCLSQDADLYLLDEPSAYLDVEQRLLISKIMRDMMEQGHKSCMVVDHDLLFIDYLSDRLIVFDGEPAKKGIVKGPYTMAEGMNMFLGSLNITMRRDAESRRPRINKPESQMDRKQKSEKRLYYS